MAKSRYTGRSAIVTFVSSSGTTFTAGLCRNIQPPPRMKATIDLTAMEDTSFTGDVGIEGESKFTFLNIIDPVDSVDVAIDALYANSEDRTWKYVMTNGTKASGRSFTGKVIGLEEQSFGANDPVTRLVTILRTGAISYSTS